MDLPTVLMLIALIGVLLSGYVFRQLAKKPEHLSEKKTAIYGRMLDTGEKL